MRNGFNLTLNVGRAFRSKPVTTNWALQSLYHLIPLLF
ncbi:unnamed protein product [Arabidopsis halleri]